MASSNGRGRASQRLDRFGTHRKLVADIPDIKAAGGWSAVAAAFVLWDWCHAYTGVVKVSVSGLAAAIDSERKTARGALACLEQLEVIRPVIDADGNRRPSEWVVVHHLADEQTQVGSKSNGYAHEEV